MELGTWNLILFALLLLAPLAVAKDPPVSGKEVAEFRSVDKAVLDFMQTIDATAATVAVSKDGKLLYSRGYGHTDAAKKKPTPPDALFRIASVSKPITASMIHAAVRDKKLSLDAQAFDLIGAKPPGRTKIADDRVKDVTVAHLLAHKGGWDAAKAGDLMFRTDLIKKELKLTRPPTPTEAVNFLLTQPLQLDPGEKEAYSNSGYCVLGRVVEAVYKKPFADCLASEVCKPLGIKDITVGVAAVKKRDAREVWYPATADDLPMGHMDSFGGLVASAPALCQFLDAYFLDGKPRQPGEWSYHFFGSLPGTTAFTRERTDGLNAAVLLNNRREKSFADDNQALKKAIDAALDTVAQKK